MKSCEHPAARRINYFLRRRIMSHSRRIVWMFAGALAALIGGAGLKAQVANNPYKVNFSWAKFEGRQLGVVGAIKPDADGKHIWILDRCGGNGCAESDLDPIIQVDMDGKLVKSFVKGVINLPHGFFVDREGYVWVTDGAPAGDARGTAGFQKHMGHQVYKFSPEGKVVMRL